MGPAVGVEDGAVEFLVGEVAPGGALVVEVGEGAFLQFFFGGTFGVEPALALFVEFLGRGGDDLDLRNRVSGICGGFVAGGPGKGEGFEAGGGGVAKTAFGVA